MTTHRARSTSDAAARGDPRTTGRRWLPPGLDLLLRAAIGLLVPLAGYYLLRAAGVGIYLALLVSTVASAAPTVVGLLRTRRVNALSAFFTAMVVGSVGVALLSGDTRFMLAREAVLTALAGAWFLVSAMTDRPLASVFSQPLLQGRFRWPSGWDQLWEGSPRWRRMWRTSSVVWGIGLLADAAGRVVLAYTLPADVVPAVATVLYVATSAGLIIVTSVYYAICGVYNPRSALYGGTANTARRRG